MQCLDFAKIGKRPPMTNMLGAEVTFSCVNNAKSRHYIGHQESSVTENERFYRSAPSITSQARSAAFSPAMISLAFRAFAS